MTMTASKPKPTYDPNKDKRPPTVLVGVSLITHEEETFIQDGRAVTCPIDEDITYLRVPREIVFLPNGGASYEIIADILDTQGFPKRIWKIWHVWEVIPQDQELF